MNSLLHRLAISATAVLVLGAVHTRAITVPGADGSDGALNITANTVIDLSQAVLGNWSDNNSASAGRGVYDQNRWAVVFKYSSVNIAQGATLRFKNHGSRAPVVWLVAGDVTINGDLRLDGEDQYSGQAPRLTEPGPGGFRGGGGSVAGYGGNSGFGPGGGFGYNTPAGFTYSGSYASLGAHDNSPDVGAIYGNTSLIPLIGGSGGHGNGDAVSGAGGGGAILIATPQTLTVNGNLTALGGYANWGNTGSGSGGGIRLVAGEFAGAGLISAAGGTGRYGGFGRVRMERVSNSAGWQIVPDPSLVTLEPSGVATIWPPAGAPEVRIVTISDGSGATTKAAPSDPRAEFGSIGADVTLPQTSQVIVTVETKNVETNSIVKVRLNSRASDQGKELNAALAQTVATSPELVLRWTATLPSNVG
jgi:hypothetical protein